MSRRGDGSEHLTATKFALPLLLCCKPANHLVQCHFLLTKTAAYKVISTVTTKAHAGPATVAHDDECNILATVECFFASPKSSRPMLITLALLAAPQDQKITTSSAMESAARGSCHAKPVEVTVSK